MGVEHLYYRNTTFAARTGDQLLNLLNEFSSRKDDTIKSLIHISGTDST